MKKKLVSVLVCAAMTAAVLAGCGNKAAETTDAPAAEETTEDAAAEETTDAAASGELIKVGIINNDPKRVRIPYRERRRYEGRCSPRRTAMRLPSHTA